MEECVLSTVGTIVVEKVVEIVVGCCKCLCACVWMNIKNFYKFNSNVDNLETQIRSLLISKKLIQDQTVSDEVDGKIRTPQVIMWLQKIEEIEESVASTRAEITANKEKLHGCRTNPCLRCKLNKQVVEKINQVRQMLSEGLPPQPLVMVDLRLKPVEERPGPSITSQNTAAKNLQNIMDQLEKDTVRVIGVFGMGGVGKTALITNLNNKLSKDDAQAFGLIVWVTVSKDADAKQMQLRLAERLQLSTSGTESKDGLATRISARLMKEQKFLLILDDVWERIDLDEVGIPRPEVHSGYKVLLTTRLSSVCDQMRANAKLQVIPLSEDESWALFAQNAGDVVNSRDVERLAKAVARECAGLPLAIIVVGRAMWNKADVKWWNEALEALQRSNSAPFIPGIEKEVYLPLKFSYDSLASQNMRECFLYCCLYPEDYTIIIKHLLQCCRAEGYLDEWEDHEDPYTFGRMVIQRLKDSCLLEGEDDSVKMHDVLRDFGIWMASTSEDGCSKSLVRSGLGLKEITEVEKWGSYRRISYMRNKIKMLPDCANSQFSQVSSLLLRWNRMIENIPAGFFQGFKALRVLDLSETSIRALPGIEHLGELRALFLRNCKNMKEFPSLRGLDRLQVFDLSGLTLINSMNEEGTVRRELRQCQHLVELYVCFSEGVLPNFNSEEDTILFKRLRRSSISIINTQDLVREKTLKYINHVSSGLVQDKGLEYINHVSIYSLTTLTESILFLVRQANSINFSSNFFRTATLVIWRCLKVGVLDRLQSLAFFIEYGIDSIDMMEDMSHDGQVLLPSLESVHLTSVPMRMINELFCLCGVNLRSISVIACNDMTKLIHFSLLHKLESLESIYLSECNNVVEIIEDEEDNCTTPRNGNGNALPNLRRIRLYNLPKLKSICKQVMSWPHIQQIQVYACPALKKLPLSCQHANTLKNIEGEQEWWDDLQWPEDATKSSLLQKFKISTIFSIPDQVRRGF